MLSNNLGSFETARSGLDYESYSETLVFEVSCIFIYHISRLTIIVLQSGQIERSIILRVRDDSEPELMEYFTVELANPTGGALLADTAVSK